MVLLSKPKPTFLKHVTVGDTTEIYERTGLRKSGAWLTPEQVHAVSHDAQIVAVS